MAEKAKLPTMGKSHQLVECIQELREALEPLTMFTDQEVFSKVTLSNWMMITLSRRIEATKSPPPQESGQSKNQRARVRGAFMMRGVGCPKPMPTPWRVHWPLQAWGWRPHLKAPLLNCEHPTTVCRYCQYPVGEPIAPNSTRTDGGTDPHSGGGVYPVCKLDGPGWMGNHVC